MDKIHKLIPDKWQTERLFVRDSLLDDIQQLQRIYDAVPQIHGWTQEPGEEEPEQPMLSALYDGVLPPQGGVKELFRLQSIYLKNTDDIVGFIAMYHGFPQPDTFWINCLVFHPDYQGKGYGSELITRWSKLVKESGGYTRMESFVNLKNWPSLRLCTKAGFNKIVKIVGDKVHTDKAEAYLLLEKSWME